MDARFHFVNDGRPRAERRREFLGRQEPWVPEYRVGNPYSRSKYSPHIGKKQRAKGDRNTEQRSAT